MEAPRLLSELRRDARSIHGRFEVETAGLYRIVHATRDGAFAVLSPSGTHNLLARIVSPDRPSKNTKAPRAMLMQPPSWPNSHTPTLTPQPFASARNPWTASVAPIAPPTAFVAAASSRFPGWSSLGSRLFLRGREGDASAAWAGAPPRRGRASATGRGRAVQRFRSIDA